MINVQEAPNHCHVEVSVHKIIIGSILQQDQTRDHYIALSGLIHGKFTATKLSSNIKVIQEKE